MKCTKFSLAMLLAGLLVWSACGGSNPFAPQRVMPEDQGTKAPIPPATTPEQLIDNLSRSLNDREPDLYESLLDENFYFTETNCLGEFELINDLETELRIMGGSRDGSRPGIFGIFRTFEYQFDLIRRSRELGPDFPKAFDGDIDGHPDEDWEVFRGRVQMLLLRSNDDGFRVDQVMTFKLRKDSDGLWKMIRWVDDPLSGDCTGGMNAKPVLGASSWSQVKTLFR